MHIQFSLAGIQVELTDGDAAKGRAAFPDNNEPIGIPRPKGTVMGC
jgi:hypothetical protein